MTASTAPTNPWSITTPVIGPTRFHRRFMTICLTITVVALTAIINILLHVLVTDRTSPDTVYLRADANGTMNQVSTDVTASIVPPVGPGVSAGIPVYLPTSDTEGSTCTLGPVISTNNALISAHCSGGATGVGLIDARTSTPVGTVTQTNPDVDIAVVTLTSTLNPDDITVSETTIDTPEIGDTLVKYGNTTGVTTGMITSVNDTTAVTSLCMLPGDSGGPVYDDQGRVIGLSTSYTYNEPDHGARNTGGLPKMLHCDNGVTSGTLTRLSTGLDMINHPTDTPVHSIH